MIDSTKLRAPTYDEQVALETYRATAQAAVTNATSFGDKVVAAAVASATAYGAVIALVAPEDSPSPIGVVLPFIAFAAALGLALWAQGVSLEVVDGNDLAKIRSSISDVISQKQNFGRWGLGMLVLGLVVAGIVVHNAYGKPAEAESKPATIWLTQTGQALVTTVCGEAHETLTGTVKDAAALGAKRVAVKVDKTACGTGAGTLVLPPSAIETARLTG